MCNCKAWRRPCLYTTASAKLFFVGNFWVSALLYVTIYTIYCCARDIFLISIIMLSWILHGKINWKFYLSIGVCSFNWNYCILKYIYNYILSVCLYNNYCPAQNRHICHLKRRLSPYPEIRYQITVYNTYWLPIIQYLRIPEWLLKCYPVIQEHKYIFEYFYNWCSLFYIYLCQD
jgi:hypothetical protein